MLSLPNFQLSSMYDSEKNRFVSAKHRRYHRECSRLLPEDAIAFKYIPAQCVNGADECSKVTRAGVANVKKLYEAGGPLAKRARLVSVEVKSNKKGLRFAQLSPWYEDPRAVGLCVKCDFELYEACRLGYNPEKLDGHQYTSVRVHFQTLERLENEAKAVKALKVVDCTEDAEAAAPQEVKSEDEPAKGEQSVPKANRKSSGNNQKEDALVVTTKEEADAAKTEAAGEADAVEEAASEAGGDDSAYIDNVSVISSSDDEVDDQEEKTSDSIEQQLLDLSLEVDKSKEEIDELKIKNEQLQTDNDSIRNILHGLLGHLGPLLPADFMKEALAVTA